MQSRKKIAVISLDFDGCVFNVTYIKKRTELLEALIAKRRVEEGNVDLYLPPQLFLYTCAEADEGPYVESIEDNDRRINDTDLVFDTNPKLMSHLCELAKDYDDVVLMVGSKRQNGRADVLGRCVNMTESCYPVLQKIADKLTEQTGKSCQVDPMLLTDLYAEKSLGEHYQACMSKQTGYLAHIRADRSKFLLVMAQMNHVASSDQMADVDYHFYDDQYANKVGEVEKPLLLKKLADFLNNHHYVIPPNTRFIPHHYEGDEVTSYDPVQGKGWIDPNWRDAFKWLRCAVGMTDPFVRAMEIDVLRVLGENASILGAFRNKFELSELTKDEKQATFQQTDAVHSTQFKPASYPRARVEEQLPQQRSMWK